MVERIQTMVTDGWLDNDQQKLRMVNSRWWWFRMINGGWWWLIMTYDGYAGRMVVPIFDIPFFSNQSAGTDQTNTEPESSPKRRFWMVLIWRLPKMGRCTPKSSILMGFSTIDQLFGGYPHSRKPPCAGKNINCFWFLFSGVPKTGDPMLSFKLCTWGNKLGYQWINTSLVFLLRQTMHFGVWPTPIWKTQHVSKTQHINIGLSRKRGNRNLVVNDDILEFFTFWRYAPSKPMHGNHWRSPMILVRYRP